MTRTIFVRAYTALNLGDDLFLKVLFERYPEHHFILFTPIKKGYEQLYRCYTNVTICYLGRIKALILRILQRFFSHNPRWPALFYGICIKKYAAVCDACVTIGGSIFMQRYSGLLYKDFCFQQVVHRFGNKPQYIIGANFGPFKDYEYKDFYARNFEKMTDVCFRDNYSFGLFSDLPNVRCAADVIFQYTVPEVVSIPDSIGVNLIRMDERAELARYSSEYLHAMAELVRQMLSQGRKVFLISFCKAEGDVAAVNQVLALLSARERELVSVLSYEGDIDSFVGQYAALESVVTIRFHATVLSLLLKQRFCPLIYSDKTLNMLHDINYAGESISIPNIKEFKVDFIVKPNMKMEQLKLSAKDQFAGLDQFLSEGKRCRS